MRQERKSNTFSHNNSSHCSTRLVGSFQDKNRHRQAKLMFVTPFSNRWVEILLNNL